MNNIVWKEFDHNPLTHSAAHYLMTIYELIDEQGFARLTDIANTLQITPGSCSLSIKALKKKGLVVQMENNKMLKLSDTGKVLAKLVANNGKLLEEFFHDVLGVDKEQAEIDACKIEHLLSIESSQKLADFLEKQK